jgi:hypothetical protein
MRRDNRLRRDCIRSDSTGINLDTRIMTDSEGHSFDAINGSSIRSIGCLISLAEDGDAPVGMRHDLSANRNGLAAHQLTEMCHCHIGGHYVEEYRDLFGWNRQLGY